MRLTALVESPHHVCCRYRLAAFQPLFLQAGHELQVLALPRSWWAWLRLGRVLRQSDCVLLQRRLLNVWQLRLVRRAARRLLFDFDDAVFLRDSYAATGLHSRRRSRRFGSLMRCVDAVVAGNSFLALGAAQAPRVHTIPTCVEPSAYQLAQHAGEGTELVWIGSSSTLQGLEAVTPLLERLGRDWPGLRLKLVCDRFLHLTDLPVVARPWSEATEAAEIATADIGISWLPDDDWSRGKCGLKVLQYMAAGLPVVANPVGVQTDLIRHGESGFLAATADAWSAAVGRLVHDAQLRRCMGAAGRRRVERDFSVTSGAARWLALLADLSTKGHAA